MYANGHKATISHDLDASNTVEPSPCFAMHFVRELLKRCTGTVVNWISKFVTTTKTIGIRKERKIAIIFAQVRGFSHGFQVATYANRLFAKAQLTNFLHRRLREPFNPGTTSHVKDHTTKKQTTKDENCLRKSTFRH